MSLALMWLLACGTPEQPPVQAADVSLQAELPGESIYQLEADLETHTGDAVKLSLYRGHPVLVSMFYASCPMACPTLIEDVKSLEARLTDAERSDLRVLLVSLDPARDTPQLMGEVVSRHDVDTERWTLARTSEDGVREVSAVLGIHYRMLEDGEMNHSSIVSLIDADGVMLEQIEGLGRSPEPILSALRGGPGK